MSQLEDINTLPTEAVELLEAVGYLNSHDLQQADAEELSAELTKANDVFSIMLDTPSAEVVEEWKNIVAAHNPSHPPKETSKQDAVSVDGEGEESDPVAPEDGEVNEQDEEEDEENDAHAIDLDPALVNFEEDPEVQEMLQISPEAVQLDPSLIRRHKLAVADIPEGILLTQCQGEVEINVMTTARLAKAQRRESELKRTGLMVSRIRDFDAANSGEHHVKPLEKGKPREAVAASDDLNVGVNPDSRRFVRGVLHPDPMSVRISAFFSVLVELMLVGNLIGIPWLLIHEHLSGNSMFWWVIGLSSGLLLSALCYAFWGISARCRVCGQRQFAPKKCLKNKKAHHIPVIGYIFPTALHAMFFKWFYCTYCGTAVRLKK
ncbi:MAG: hypothetical protein KJO79_02170 [Verrucomicrobiae bacterium]|nr:hypothetical protein [Verrucomicrobiae bacterium]NNJ85959.1 hypothetical protein [Akkermansiaceae bacterium]